MSPPIVLDIFRVLFSQRWIANWQKKHKRTQDKSAQRFYDRVFSLRIILWYLVFQRLNADHTQAAVVVNLRAGGADRLRRRQNKRAKAPSAQTSAYNQARQRVPLELLQDALSALRQSLLKRVGLAPGPKPRAHERTRQILDGSTLGMLATPALSAAYPPASNKNGKSDWCLMRIVVGFCARSGAVLSAIEGAVGQSEQALAWALMEQAAPFTIWIGDRNFGIWSMAAQARRYTQDLVVRMTRERAAKLCQGRPLQSGEERIVQWCPGRKDKSPKGLQREAVCGRLIYVRLNKGGRLIDLWLFTTLEAQEYPIALLVQWYGQRWQAELHFRSVKTQMGMSELDVCTPAMAQKEFYAGLLAYSLVRAVMWEAGECLEEGIKKISFSQARRVLLEGLKEWGRQTQAEHGWSRSLVEEVSQHTLSKRRQERPGEIRRVRHRRQKFPPFRGSRAAARLQDLARKSS